MPFDLDKVSEGVKRTGEETVSGRPVYTDSNGQRFSEKTVTFPIDDKWYTFPAVDSQGRVQSEDVVREYVKNQGPVDPITGERLPSFDSRQAAEAYAKQRSANRTPKDSGMPKGNPEGYTNGEGKKPVPNVKSGFDLQSFSEGLQRQQQLIDERQAEAAAHAARTTQIQKENTRLKRQHNKAIEPIRQNLQEIQLKTQHERSLKSSDNIVDLLRLRGLKLMDPQGYDPKKRSAMLAEDMQRASAIAHVYGVSQQALEAELALSAAKLDEKKVIEAIGHEKLTRIQEEAAMATANLSAHITMQEVATHGLSSDQLMKLIQQAETSPEGMVELGGVEVSADMLKNRLAAIEEREYQQQRAAFDRAIGEAEMEDAGIIIEGQRLDRRLEAMKSADAARDRELATRDLTELEMIQENNYTDETGVEHNPELVNKYIADRTEAKSARIKRLGIQARLGSFDDDMLVDERQRIEELEQRVPEGTQLRRATSAYKQSIGFAATLTGPENDLVTRREGIAIIDNAREELNKSIEDQVKKETGDKQMQNLLRAYYQGNRLPEDQLEDAVAERLRNHDSLRGIFPPQIADEVSIRYKAELSRLLKEGTSMVFAGQEISGIGTTNATDRKLMEERAIRSSIAWGLRQYAGLRADDMVSGQVTDRNHPLHGKWGRDKMAVVIKSADNAAEKRWIQKFGLSDSQVQAIHDGRQPSDIEIRRDELEAELLAMENDELVKRLEAEQTGLASKVAHWWERHGFEYVHRNQQEQANKAISFQHVATQELSGARERSTMQGYARSLGVAVDSMFDEHALRASEFVTFGANPTHAQAAILNADPNLKSHEKKRIFTEVLQPLLMDAEQRGFNFAQANAHVERQLMNVQPEDKELARLLKTMNRERARIIETYDTWAGAARDLPAGPGPRQTLSTPPGPGRISSIGWYSELMNQRQAPPELPRGTPGQPRGPTSPQSGASRSVAGRSQAAGLGVPPRPQ